MTVRNTSQVSLALNLLGQKAHSGFLRTSQVSLRSTYSVEFRCCETRRHRTGKIAIRFAYRGFCSVIPAVLIGRNLQRGRRDSRAACHRPPRLAPGKVPAQAPPRLRRGGRRGPPRRGAGGKAALREAGGKALGKRSQKRLPLRQDPAERQFSFLRFVLTSCAARRTARSPAGTGRSPRR